MPQMPKMPKKRLVSSIPHYPTLMRILLLQRWPLPGDQPRVNGAKPTMPVEQAIAEIHYEMHCATLGQNPVSLYKLDEHLQQFLHPWPHKRRNPYLNGQL